MNDTQQTWVAELAGQYGRLVFATAYRLLGNAEDAEDVLQDVFLKLLRGRVDRETPREWAAYLCTMTTHASIDLMRRASRRKEFGADWLDGVAASGRADPRTEAQLGQQALLLRKALAALPRREAVLFSLRYFDDLSYQQIAGELDMTANQVGVQLHRIRRRLMDWLKPWMDADPGRVPDHDRSESSQPRT